MTATPAVPAVPGTPTVAPTPDTGRVQLALNVDDIDAAVAFYSTLLGTGPAKRRPGYANFAVATPPLKLVLLENPGSGGTLNHLGVEVPDTAAVRAEVARLSGEGLSIDEEMGTTCCFATQNKVWVTGADGERWEVYTVLADSPTFGTSAQTLPDTGTPTALVDAPVRDPQAPAAPDRPVGLAARGKPAVLRARVSRARAAVAAWLRHGQLQVQVRCCDWPA